MLVVSPSITADICWPLLRQRRFHKIPFPGRSSSHLLSMKDIRHIIRHNYRISFLDSHQIIHIHCICALPNHCPFPQTKHFTSFPILTKSNIEQRHVLSFYFFTELVMKNQWMNFYCFRSPMFNLYPPKAPTRAHGDKIERSTPQTDKELLL